MARKVLNGLDLSSQKITNVLDPTSAQDAATKNYVDSAVGTPLIEDRLEAWTEGEAYELTAITYDSTYPQVISTGTVGWPDGSAGTFTTDTINTTWIAVDAYHITHTTSGKTVTQAAVTRDSTTGQVTAKPALTVA